MAPQPRRSHTNHTLRSLGDRQNVPRKRGPTPKGTPVPGDDAMSMRTLPHPAPVQRAPKASGKDVIFVRLRRTRVQMPSIQGDRRANTRSLNGYTLPPRHHRDALFHAEGTVHALPSHIPADSRFRRTLTTFIARYSTHSSHWQSFHGSDRTSLTFRLDSLAPDGSQYPITMLVVPAGSGPNQPQ